MMFSSSSFDLASSIFSAIPLVFSMTTFAPMLTRTLSAFGGDARSRIPAPTGTRTSSVVAAPMSLIVSREAAALDEHPLEHPLPVGELVEGRL